MPPPPQPLDDEPQPVPDEHLGLRKPSPSWLKTFSKASSMGPSVAKTRMPKVPRARWGLQNRPRRPPPRDNPSPHRIIVASVLRPFRVWCWTHVNQFKMIGFLRKSEIYPRGPSGHSQIPLLNSRRRHKGGKRDHDPWNWPPLISAWC